MLDRGRDIPIEEPKKKAKKPKSIEWPEGLVGDYGRLLHNKVGCLGEPIECLNLGKELLELANDKLRKIGAGIQLK